MIGWRPRVQFAKARACGHDTHVDELGLVAGLEVVEDGGLVEVGQVGHVLTLLKLGRVHLHHTCYLINQLKR